MEKEHLFLSLCLVLALLLTFCQVRLHFDLRAFVLALQLHLLPVRAPQWKRRLSERNR